jgi:hypothetical protein
MQKLNLGKKAKDKITGFEGFLTGHANYITGCDQYLIQPSAKEGEFKDPLWFDESRLEIISDGITEEEVKGEENGCDYSAPIK